MTNPVERERIAREVAEELGCEIVEDKAIVDPEVWFYGFTHEYLPNEIRDALIEARCRVEELEATLRGIDEMLDGGLPITHQVKSIARLALREKEPKV